MAGGIVGVSVTEPPLIETEGVWVGAVIRMFPVELLMDPVKPPLGAVFCKPEPPELTLTLPEPDPIDTVGDATILVVAKVAPAFD